DLLRSGATLTNLMCPACSSPLFELKSGEIWCAQCQKKVVVVKEEESVEAVKGLIMLDEVESTLLMKIKEINERIQKESSIEELQRLSIILSNLLENLDKTRKIKKYEA
ncbi:MAG: Sjogren's syndrome/scleroderma autoantigen 1 family protein, partial [Candidatus Bathyarchaeia archaeon]